MAPLFALGFDLDQSAGRQMTRMHHVSTDIAKVGHDGGVQGRSAAGQAADMIRNNFQNPKRASFGRCTACGLRSLSICGALDDADISEFERMARHVHLAPNEALFTAGEVAGAVHSMMSGVVRLYKLMPDGRRQVLGFALPGDFLGIAPSDRYSFSADAVDTVSACRFPVEAFTHFIEERPQLLLRINEFAARELDARPGADAAAGASLIGREDRVLPGRLAQSPGANRRQQGHDRVADEPSGYRGLSGADDRNGEPYPDAVRTGKLLVIVRGGVRLLDQNRAAALAAA